MVLHRLVCYATRSSQIPTHVGNVPLLRSARPWQVVVINCSLFTIALPTQDIRVAAACGLQCSICSDKPYVLPFRTSMLSITTRIVRYQNLAALVLLLRHNRGYAWSGRCQSTNPAQSSLQVVTCSCSIKTANATSLACCFWGVHAEASQ